jgi:uncharacterized protein (DUF1015 family)
LDQFFTLTIVEEKSELKSQMAEHGVHAIGIGVYGESKYFLAVLRELVESENSDGISPVRYAPVICEEVIRGLADGESDGSGVVEIGFSSDTEKVWNTLESGEAQIVAFTNPTPVETVLSTMSAGVPVPNGAIDFYPHLPLGLVLHAFPG